MALCSLAFCSVIYKEEALSNADGMHKHLLMRWRGWWRRGSEVGGPPTSKGAPFFQSFWGSTVYWYISVTWLRGYIFFLESENFYLGFIAIFYLRYLLSGRENGVTFSHVPITWYGRLWLLVRAALCYVYC